MGNGRTGAQKAPPLAALLSRAPNWKRAAVLPGQGQREHSPRGHRPTLVHTGSSTRALGLPLAPGRAALLRGQGGQAPSRGMEMSPVSASAGQAGAQICSGTDRSLHALAFGTFHCGKPPRFNASHRRCGQCCPREPQVSGVRGRDPLSRVGHSGGVSLAGRLLSLDKEMQGGFAVPRPWGYRGGAFIFSA